MSKTIFTAASLGKLTNELLLRVINVQEKKQAVWFFEETKRVNSCLTHCSQQQQQQKQQKSILRCS